MHNYTHAIIKHYIYNKMWFIITMDGVLDWDGRDIKIVLEQPIKDHKDTK